MNLEGLEEEWVCFFPSLLKCKSLFRKLKVLSPLCKTLKKCFSNFVWGGALFIQLFLPAFPRAIFYGFVISQTLKAGLEIRIYSGSFLKSLKRDEKRRSECFLQSLATTLLQFTLENIFLASRNVLSESMGEDIRLLLHNNNLSSRTAEIEIHVLLLRLHHGRLGCTNQACRTHHSDE